MAGVIAPVPINSDPGSYAWVEWYTQLTNYINSGVQVSWAQIGFAGSTLSSIAVRLHSNLQTIQGTNSNLTAYHMYGVGTVISGVLSGPTGWSVAGGGSSYVVTFPAITAMTDLVVTATSMTTGVSVQSWAPISVTTFSVTLSGSGNFSFHASLLESSST